MKRMKLMAVSVVVCLCLAGCGSSDRNRQDREPQTAQAAGMAQESGEQKNGTQLAAGDVSVLQKETQNVQTEWDGQEEDPQDTTKGMENGADWEEALGENGSLGYTVNEDGTYAFEGETFQYKMLLDSGKGGCRYLVLTNNENLTYDDVQERMYSSYWGGPSGETAYVMLGILGEDEEEEDYERNGEGSRPYRVWEWFVNR